MKRILPLLLLALGMSGPLAATDGAATVADPAAGAQTGTSVGSFSHWEVIQQGGVCYVSADSIALFYRFPKHSVEGGQVAFSSPSIVVRSALGGREMTVNNLKFFLSEPVLDLNGKVYFSQLDLAKSLDPILRCTVSQHAFDTVVLDPDPHPDGSGSASGAPGSSASGASMALKTALALRTALQELGLKVVMMREADAAPSSDGRQALVDAAPHAIYLGLRFEEGGADPGGVLTFVMAPRGGSSDSAGPGDEDRRRFSGNAKDHENVLLGTAIQGCLVTRLKLPDLGLQRTREPVLRDLTMPGAILVVGNLRHEADAKRYGDETFQKVLAKALAQSLLQFRDLMAPQPAQSPAATK